MQILLTSPEQRNCYSGLVTTIVPMKSHITRDLKIQVKIIAIFISAILPYFSSQAQKPLNIKFRSRGLLDASISGYDNNETKSYFSLEDFRIGFKASYKKDEIKVDIGIDESKLKIKDLIYNRHFKKSTLSIGNMYEPFSMDMLISTADLRFHQSATSVQAFTNSRRFGTTYIRQQLLFCHRSFYQQRHQ